MTLRKPGAKAIVVYQDKILLVLRDDNPAIAYPNTWNTPGGGIEEGESPEEALVRELQEEICMTPSSVINLGTTTYTDGSLVHRYYVPVTEEEFPQIRLGNEGQRIGWFTLEELLKLNVSPHSFVYYKTHEQDIKEILFGNYHFVPRHDVLESEE
ncbi:NUDIX domain-containing protein [Candidatus Uhrbacteria bacterium]|nr:NUDIX domain-containing protein [Candidatus Uhrbacteria bacterium]